MQKGKWLSEEALKIDMKRREGKGKGEKEKYLTLLVGMQTSTATMENSVEIP